MTWQPDAAFIDGLNFFTSAVSRLVASDWERPSPCEGWRTLDVLGHVGAAVQFGTLLLTLLSCHPVTVRSADALIPSEVTVMVTVPGRWAVTTPVTVSTLATLGAELVQ